MITNTTLLNVASAPFGFGVDGCALCLKAIAPIGLFLGADRRLSKH
jgi:hypothetical protein